MKTCSFELKVTACAPAISFYQRVIWGKKDAAMSRQFARYGSGNPHRCQDNGTYSVDTYTFKSDS